MQPKDVHGILNRHILADGLDLVFDSDRSAGAILYDALHEREYLDLFSFFASMPVGFGHPRLKDPEYLARLHGAAAYKPTNPDIYTVELARFVDTFAKVATRGAFPHHFFVEGGALGVENSLKVAFDWKARRNLSRGRAIGRQVVIHFEEAFHGRSGYALSLTNTYDPRKYQYFPKFDWPRIVNPKLRFPMTAEVEAEVSELEQEALRQIDRVIDQGADDIACLIIEPIQAEGGDNHFRPSFLAELRRRADEGEFLLIFDEVQTGGGLLGAMWGYEVMGVRPDVIAFGKKFQLGGCAAGARVDEVPDNVFRVSSRINSTWGGNLTDMVRGQRYLEIIDDEKLCENAAHVGAYLVEELLSLAKRWPELTNVRGRGLMIAFDLPSAEQRDALRKKIREEGALLLACGHRSLRLRPVLDFTRRDAARALEIFETSLKALYGK
jgi:L-lysine 6-transaminase